jgi:hypothetical protein
MVDWTPINPRYTDQRAFATSQAFYIVHDGNVYRMDDGEGWEFVRSVEKEFERGDAEDDRILAGSRWVLGWTE